MLGPVNLRKQLLKDLFHPSTNNRLNVVRIAPGLHQTKKESCSYAAGKLAVGIAPEHALNSLCNERNLLLQPISQNCLSILTLNLKK